MAGFGPTPDFPTVVLKWAGVGLDGNAETGTISLTYNATVPLLDDDATLPVSVYPRTLTAAIATTTIAVDTDANSGTPAVTKTVGYWTLTVPASNATSVIGSGGTYTLTENLTRGGGVTRTFFADKDVAGGVIWVNRLPAGGESTPAAPYSVVTAADLANLQAQINSISGGSGSSTTPALSFVDRGSWTAGLSYSVGSIVTYSGQRWLASAAISAASTFGFTGWIALGAVPDTF